MDLKSKHIMTVGGAGFIGSSLTRELVDRGANVFVYDNFIYGDQQNIAEISDQIHIVDGDILSGKLYTTMQECKIDYVFNLAAEPYIPHCYDNPEKFFDVNVKGTMNVLWASKLFDVQKVVHFSSSEVYGTSKYVPMDEDHPTLPLSTYAVSKLAADRLCHVWAKEHEIPVVILRLFNVYGERESQPYVIPEIITQLSKSSQVKLGNIKAERDFTYVGDAVEAIVELLNNDILVGEVVNLGSNKTYSIEELAHIIGNLLNYDNIEIIVEKSRLRPIDVDRLQCDYSKIRKLIGWIPKTTIEQGLSKTIDWYHENGCEWSWEKRAGGTFTVLPKR